MELSEAGMVFPVTLRATSSLVEPAKEHKPRHDTYNKRMDQPGKVANPVRGQLNRENEYFPVRARA